MKMRLIKYFSLLFLPLFVSAIESSNISPIDVCPTDFVKINEEVAKVVITETIAQDTEIDALFEEEQLAQAWTKWQVMSVVIKDWSANKQEQLGIKVDDTILYPFGGGDVVFPFSFFPDFHQLIIIGLEPVGKEFSLKSKEGIISNMAYFLSHGNFVTRDMEQFASSGMTTVILIQLRKLGATNIEYVISPSMVEFKCKLNGIERKITYIKMNLDDKNYAAWAPLFDKYKKYTLFMKSASFVPQQPGFEKIKIALISGARVILQDDTGVAYADLLEAKFNVDLCGSYCLRYTIRGLEHFFQEDLKEAYTLANPELLPFAIGYRSETVPGNILWAYKL